MKHVLRLMIIACVGAALAGCTMLQSIAQTTPSPVVTATTGPVQATNQVTVDGRVVPLRAADLVFAATGVISDVLVAEGDQVEQDALLAQLDDTQQQAAIRQARATVAQAQAAVDQLRAQPYAEDLAAAEAALAQAESQADYQRRIDAPRIDRDAASAQVDQAQAQLDALQSAPRQDVLNAALADLDAARSALDQAQAALITFQLRAPFAGIIASIDLGVGEVFAPSATTAGTPAIRLADQREWDVETADLTELQVVSLEVGDLATVSIDALPNLQLRGTVERIGRYGTDQQGDIVYQVLVDLDQSDARLRWNMTAAVTIEPDVGARSPRP